VVKLEVKPRLLSETAQTPAKSMKLFKLQPSIWRNSSYEKVQGVVTAVREHRRQAAASMSRPCQPEKKRFRNADSDVQIQIA
jgi:hypothetical protein